MVTMQQQLQAVLAQQDLLAKSGGAVDGFADHAPEPQSGPMVATVPALSSSLHRGTAPKTAAAALGPPPRTKVDPVADAVSAGHAVAPIQGSCAVGGKSQMISAISQQSLAPTQLVAHLAGGDAMSDLAASSSF